MFHSFNILWLKVQPFDTLCDYFLSNYKNTDRLIWTCQSDFSVITNSWFGISLFTGYYWKLAADDPILFLLLFF